MLIHKHLFWGKKKMEEWLFHKALIDFPLPLVERMGSHFLEYPQ